LHIKLLLVQHETVIVAQMVWEIVFRVMLSQTNMHPAGTLKMESRKCPIWCNNTNSHAVSWHKKLRMAHRQARRVTWHDYPFKVHMLARLQVGNPFERPAQVILGV